MENITLQIDDIKKMFTDHGMSISNKEAEELLNKFRKLCINIIDSVVEKTEAN